MSNWIRHIYKDGEIKMVMYGINNQDTTSWDC